MGVILGLCWDMGKLDGHYQGLDRDYIGVRQGTYWDNGKVNGNCYNGESNEKEHGKEHGK